MSFKLKKKRNSLMEMDSGVTVAGIRKSPLVSNLSKMNKEHCAKDDSMFSDYGGKQEYLGCMDEAERLYGRSYRSALEQSVYLTWSTGRKHVVATHMGCGSPIYEAAPESKIKTRI